MPFRKSIAARIFGLALFLLVLTIALVCFLLSRVARLKNELQAMATCDLPLESTISRLDEHGLRRRLAFERWFGALNSDTPNAEIVKEAQDNYEQFSGGIDAEFSRARELLARPPVRARDVAELAGLAATIRQIEAAFPTITARQQEVLDLQRQGDHARANLLVDGLNDLQRLVQTQREEVRETIARRAEVSSQVALADQRSIMMLSIAATISTVLLGLIVAALVTKALVRPVRSLIGALHDVQDGRLDIDLPVSSSDEIGTLTASFNYFVQELRSKARMKETFGKYVDPRILERVLLATESADGAGERQVMTVAFGDLVGFTGLSERLTPSLMVKVLNRHFGLQAQAVQEHQGVVDKFIGDAIMSFFGPPFVAPEEHAALACRAALAQIATLDTLRRELPELTGLRRDPPAIDLRIGLATGEVIVGNIGSENTRSYTVIGDTVNLAARLEAANRHYGTHILLSEGVVADAGDALALRELDAIAVKGKAEPVRIFELLGLAGSLSEPAQLARDAYAQGLRAYRDGDWEGAEQSFARSLESRPADRAAQVMIERLAVLRAQPPGEAWDGVWRFDQK